MLRHLGEIETSRALRAAIMNAISEGATTPDIGGTLSCSEFTSEVKRRLVSSMQTS